MHGDGVWGGHAVLTFPAQRQPGAPYAPRPARPRPAQGPGPAEPAKGGGAPGPHHLLLRNPPDRDHPPNEKDRRRLDAGSKYYHYLPVVCNLLFQQQLSARYLLRVANTEGIDLTDSSDISSLSTVIGTPAYNKRETRESSSFVV